MGEQSGESPTPEPTEQTTPAPVAEVNTPSPEPEKPVTPEQATSEHRISTRNRIRDIFGRIFQRMTPNDPSQKQESSMEKKMSRRTFLEVGGAVTAGAALSSGSSASELTIQRQKSEATMIKVKEVSEQLGIDLSEVAEKGNFIAQVDITNKKGPYIFHFRQTHTHPRNVTDTNLSEVIQSQQDIEFSLEELKKRYPEMQAVFAEGYTQSVEQSQQLLRDYYQQIQALPIEPASYEKLLTIHNSLSVSPNRGFSETKLFLDSVFLDKFRLLETQIGSDITDGVIQSYRDIARATSFSIKTQTETFSPYIFGAVFKMMLDGKVQIQPTESLKELDESMKNVGDVNDLEKHEKEVYSDREQAILINISNSPVAKTQHVLPLVLGAAHDIAPELLEWNRHSRQKFGLITFTPEKTK